jgi:hypothetical protein
MALTVPVACVEGDELFALHDEPVWGQFDFATQLRTPANGALPIFTSTRCAPSPKTVWRT